MNTDTQITGDIESIATSGDISASIDPNNTEEIIENTEFLEDFFVNPMETISNIDRVQILVFIAIFGWIVTLIRVAKDSSARMRSIWMQILSILLVTILTPFVGLPIYLAIRPHDYKKNMLAWREMLDLQTVTCEQCNTINLYDYKHCAYCGNGLHIACSGCNMQAPYDHIYCHQCGKRHGKNKGTK